MYPTWDELRGRVEYETLLKLCQERLISSGSSLTDEEAAKLIEEAVLSWPKSRGCSHREMGELIRRLFFRLRRDLDILTPYAQDAKVTEIMVNGPEKIFIERGATMSCMPESFDSAEQLEQLIRRIGAAVHREINDANPILDARLADGSRVSAISKNIALNGPILTIRRFPKHSISMEDLVNNNTLTTEAARFLKDLVRAGYNIFLSGRTNSGKTTMLNALIGFIPKQERIIVIEDSAELQVPDSGRNVVRMETRNANAQGKGKISIGDLIRASLRMRPDRIIVGEVRGGEIVDMIGARQTGHDGSLSTGHGNSPAGMLRRMEAMFLSAVEYPVDSIRAQIAEAVDIIVHMDRLQDRSRRVMEIVEVISCETGQIGINPLFYFSAGEGLRPSENQLRDQGRLQRYRMYQKQEESKQNRQSGSIPSIVGAAKRKEPIA